MTSLLTLTDSLLLMAVLLTLLRSAPHVTPLTLPRLLVPAAGAWLTAWTTGGSARTLLLLALWLLAVRLTSTRVTQGVHDPSPVRTRQFRPAAAQRQPDLHPDPPPPRAADGHQPLPRGH